MTNRFKRKTAVLAVIRDATVTRKLPIDFAAAPTLSTSCSWLGT